jgi:hypothetical protein
MRAAAMSYTVTTPNRTGTKYWNCPPSAPKSPNTNCIACVAPDAAIAPVAGCWTACRRVVKVHACRAPWVF